MKKEIVYTDKYALILSDEEITEQTGNDTIFNKNLNAIIAGVYDDDDNQFKVLAHLPLSDAPILEGVPLLPSFRWSQQDDVNKLAYEQWKKPDYRSGNPPYIYGIGFYEGYNKAKEKYKYTEEDLKLAMNYGYVQGDTGFQGVANLDDLLDLIHRKIKKPSRPTHFECETTEYTVGEMSFMPIGTPNQKPKTITNSQGQVELVGKYLNL